MYGLCEVPPTLSSSAAAVLGPHALTVGQLRSFIHSLLADDLRRSLRSICHIRNPTRFSQYQAAKDAMAARLGAGAVNERWLWHGTKRDSLRSIMANG